MRNSASSTAVFLLLQAMSFAERLVDLVVLGLGSSLSRNEGGVGVGADVSVISLDSDGVKAGVGPEGGGGVGTDEDGFAVGSDGGGTDGGSFAVCIGVDGSLLMVSLWYMTSSSPISESTYTTIGSSSMCISC